MPFLQELLETEPCTAEPSNNIFQSYVDTYEILHFHGHNTNNAFLLVNDGFRYALAQVPQHMIKPNPKNPKLVRYALMSYNNVVAAPKLRKSDMEYIRKINGCEKIINASEVMFYGRGPCLISAEPPQYYSQYDSSYPSIDHEAEDIEMGGTNEIHSQDHAPAEPPQRDLQPREKKQMPAPTLSPEILDEFMAIRPPQFDHIHEEDSDGCLTM